MLLLPRFLATLANPIAYCQLRCNVRRLSKAAKEIENQRLWWSCYSTAVIEGWGVMVLIGETGSGKSTQLAVIWENDMEFWVYSLGFEVWGLRIIRRMTEQTTVF
ncbi:putative P-loop containing nucleoside triphosphate hydrolase [Helianthus annuus]|nr:putative P-loop containing nucleoside triphosphate hydrolase [Helianthus annuus]KAJ0932721.1 putative P-loop containing nucleoside triphosphate hydrolase [Helianthus annuus]